MSRLLIVLASTLSTIVLVVSPIDAQRAPLKSRQWELEFSYGRVTGGPTDRVLQELHAKGYGPTAKPAFSAGTAN